MYEITDDVLKLFRSIHTHAQLDIHAYSKSFLTNHKLPKLVYITLRKVDWYSRWNVVVAKIKIK